MCGICGIFRFDGKKINEGLLSRQVNSINHRGPDGNGVWVKNNVGLGHVRLSILELSDAGAQPMVSQQNDGVLSYNGEIYNYPDLRDKYAPEKGYKGHSDTEVLLYGFLKKGLSLLDELEGMFAFAFYNTKTEELYLVRDHFGIKPIYYHINKERILFASEIRALLVDESIQREVNDQSIKEHLLLGYAQEPETAFKNIFKLSSAHYMKISKKGVEIKVYWSRYELLNSLPKQNLVNTIQSSIYKHTVSDVPLGMFLSGGFDSNLILHYLDQIGKTGTDFNAFNAGIENPKSESHMERALHTERDIAIKSAEKYHVMLQKVPVGSSDFISFEEVIKIAEEPICNPSNFLIQIICKQANLLGNKVLLSGHGGDEVFGGYRRHVAARYLSLLKFAPLRVMGEIYGRFKNSNDIKRIVNATHKFNDFPLFDFVAIGDELIFNENLLSNFISRLDRKDISGKMAVLNENRTLSFLKQMMLLEFPTYLAAQNLINMDKFSMHNSVEVRVPFIDKKVANFGINQTDKDLIRKGKNKSLIRELAKKTLIKDLQKTGKSGFGPSLSGLLQSDEVRNLLLGKTTRDRGLFNTKKN